MSDSAVVINLTDSLLTLTDGSDVPKTLDIPIDQGEMKFSYQRTIFPTHARKTIVAVREGKDAFHDLSLKVGQEQLFSASDDLTPSLFELLFGKDKALQMGWARVWAGSAWALDLKTYAKAPAGSGKKSQVWYHRKLFAIDFSPSEGEAANMIDVKCKYIDIDDGGRDGEPQ